MANQCHRKHRSLEKWTLINVVEHTFICQLKAICVMVTSFHNNNGDQALCRSNVTEVTELLKLSVPLAITSLSWVGMATTDTAVVGHLGTRYLAAAATADLWTSSTGVFISGGVLGFFCGRSIGANQQLMAGVWLQVSLCVLSVIAVAVMVSWICTGEILKAMGESPHSAGRSTV
jgi:Na+-driven multidrug efflux pump